MAFRMRKPSLLAIVLGTIVVIILVSLGTWQLDRRAWKQELIATIDARIAEPVVDLPSSLDSDWNYRRVQIVGQVVPGSWFRFPGRTRDGEVRDVLMLLIALDDGRVVAAEHGHVGFGELLPPLPGSVALSGVLRPPGEPGFFTPPNNVSANQWFWVELPLMFEIVGMKPSGLTSHYLSPGDWRPRLPNDHLQYALTWFSFVVIFIVIFVLFHRRKS